MTTCDCIRFGPTQPSARRTTWPTGAFNASGGANGAHYVASKHAVAGLTKSIAVQLAAQGIRAVSVAPTLSLTQGVQADYDAGAGAALDAYGATLPSESGPLDLDALLTRADEGTTTYCCGPGSLLAAVEARCAASPTTLSEEEQLTGTTMMICVSRALTDRLVLQL